MGSETRNIREILLALSYRNNGDWDKIYEAIRQKEKMTDEMIREALGKTKAKYFTILDDNYPKMFQQVTKPPFLLYYYGNLQLLKSKYRMTAVGTRMPTLYQNDTVYSFIKEAEEKMDRQIVIVSGMAKGIDQTAMKAAKEMNAPVIAVIGSGIDAPYPSDNDGIYEYCKSGKGLVLSEYPLDCKAAPDHFVFRNRILAALSMVLFVGGGKRHSGTMSTVRQALEINDEILALPCNVTGDDLTNDLIRDGANSVLSSQDLVEVLKARYDDLS